MSCKNVYICTVEGKAQCEFYNGVEGYRCDYYDLCVEACGHPAAREAALQREWQHSRATDLSDKNPGCAKCKYVLTPAFRSAAKLDLQFVYCTHPERSDTVYDCFAGNQNHYRTILDFNTDGECERFEDGKK